MDIDRNDKRFNQLLEQEMLNLELDTSWAEELVATAGRLQTSYPPAPYLEKIIGYEVQKCPEFTRNFVFEHLKKANDNLANEITQKMVQATSFATSFLINAGKLTDSEDDENHPNLERLCCVAFYSAAMSLMLLDTKRQEPYTPEEIQAATESAPLHMRSTIQSLLADNNRYTKTYGLPEAVWSRS